MGFKVMGWDASGPVLTVGYIEDGLMLAEFCARQPKIAGSHLVDWIDRQVEFFGRPDGVAVGVGPGSFTGVRVAVTAAKAYAFSWGVPVKGVSSLAAWARSVPLGRRVLVTSERRGPAFYLGYYWTGNAGPEALFPDTAISGELPSIFPVADDVTVIGPLSRDPVMMARIGPRARGEAWDISGVHIALQGWPELQWGKGDDPVTLAPAYLRPPAISEAK